MSRVAPTAPGRPRPGRPHPWVCAAVNLLAFPGLGTIMAGRRQGYWQAALMLVGFGLVMSFVVVAYAGLLRLALDLHWSEQSFYARLRVFRWVALGGLLLCAAAWLWALGSSIAFLREARKTPPVLPPNTV